MRPDQYRGQIFRGDRARPRWPHPERPSGRHALDEEALFTPIFHEMTRDDLPVIRDDGPGDVEREVDRFERDPLTAPIPMPVLRSTWLPDVPPAAAESFPRPSPPPEQQIRRRVVRHAPAPPQAGPSGYRWDGREWRPAPAPWETDPAMQAISSTGRHHLVA